MAEHTNAIVDIARSWIGTPYVHQASVKGAGADCLGLVRGVWREHHRCADDPEPLPPYTPGWAEEGEAEALLAAARRHLAAKEGPPAPGDVALFRMTAGGAARHCGILAGTLEALTLIHAWEGHAVAEVPFGRWWRRRLAALFTFTC